MQHLQHLYRRRRSSSNSSQQDNQSSSLLASTSSSPSMREIPIIEEDEHNLMEVSLEDSAASSGHHLSQSAISLSYSNSHESLQDSRCFNYAAQSITRNRKVFVATVLIAVTIVGSSLLRGSGSDLTQPKIKQRIVDVNGPPEGIGLENATSSSSSHNKKPKKHKNKKNKKKNKKLEKFNTGVSRLTSTILSDDEDDQPLLVIDNDDDQVPTGIITRSSGSNFLHASDALECRESVISFVINATDGKDECDGLKRAFDKTCNSDASEEITSKQQQQQQHQETTEESEAEAKQSFQENQRRRRRLIFAASQPETIHQRLQILIFQTTRFFQSTLVDPFLSQKPKLSVFFAEDEVLGRCWEDAQYLVDNDLDKMMHAKLSRRLKSDEKEHKRESNSKDEQKKEEPDQEHDKSKTNSKPDAGDEVEDDNNENDAKQEEEEEKPATKELKAIEKPKQSLTLPTSNMHMSGTMLSETLLLQKEDTIKIAMKAAANHTGNATMMSEAAVDAAASSKAVQDASAAVTAVLNDPSSVEARTCCASILNVFHENCDTPDEENVSDKKLFLIVFVIALCGMVKSVIRFYQVRWLPEAAGCILVGVLGGAVMSFVPHYDISFDGDWFLRIMVPPIVFEAALSIDKRSFNRHIWPIIIYAVGGTLLATVITAFILHKGTAMLPGCETIPYVESLTFGALISSIDPIAVLSVLSNMGMTDTDTIYVLIFGESLLNDGVALVLFQTLVHFLDESLVIDSEAVTAAAIHFLVVAIGSLCVGIGSGVACTLYYCLMQGCQTPLVEVLLFFCWAFIPYYICDGIGWSGIVAVVATGFVMDLYVVGQGSDSIAAEGINSAASRLRDGSKQVRRDFFSTHGYLSQLAKTHVHFVAELLATMMETAIFAYLGVFLFSYRYHWNFLHTFLAILACCVSRAIMIPFLSLIANWVAKLQRASWSRRKGRLRVAPSSGGLSSAASTTQSAPGVIIDAKMQMVLWVAGLRGAMSFALVENIPLYDTVTGEGSKVKPELKAMTSATIVFTVFVLGGYTYYLMDNLGMTPNHKEAAPSETKPLVKRSSETQITGGAVNMDEVNHASTVRHRPKDKIVAY